MDHVVATHLAECPACAAHLRELVDFMDGLRAEADTETDAIFTPERLRNQQQQILHRLEHFGHAARVLSFPARLMGRRMVRTASRIAPRWAIAAAAAGLFVGVGVGTLIDPATGSGACADGGHSPGDVAGPPGQQSAGGRRR